MPKRKEISASNIKRSFRDDFNSASLDTASWEIVQNNNMTVAMDGSQLRITTGTTNGAICVIRCKHRLWLSVDAYAVLSISARRANQVFRFELISEDGLDGCGWEYTGTAAATSNYYTKNNGVITTTSMANAQNTSSLARWEVMACPDKVIVNNNPLTDNMAQRTDVVVQNCPSPEKVYYLQIYAENTGVPAGSTDIAFDAISFVHIEELYSTILAGRGSYMTHGAIPILGAVRNYVVYYSDTTTPLGASTSFTGTSRALFNPGMVGKFRAFAYADQAGTLKIEQSRTGSTWYQMASASVSANTPTTLESNIYMQYVRVAYTNGATAQSSFELNSCAVSM